MKVAGKFLCAAAALLFGSVGHVWGNYSFTTIDDPTATSWTRLTGISGDTIVGYSDHGGFSITKGVISTVLSPIGGLSHPTAVSGDTVAGWYYDSTGASHGFTLNNGVYAILDDPSAVATKDASGNLYGTIVTGISGSTVVGYYSDGGPDVNGSASYTGFIESGGAFTPLVENNVPPGNALQSTTPTGISGNTVVGNYGVIPFFGPSHVISGFSETNGVYTDLPGMISAGISGSALLGRVFDPTYSTVEPAIRVNGVDTFLIDPLTYIDPVGGPFTEATGVDGTDVVGYYYSADGTQHGFLATLDTPEPATAALLGFGLLALTATRRSKK